MIIVMPKGIKGFQKGHSVLGGIETRFKKGLIPTGGFSTRFKKGHNSYERTKEWREIMRLLKLGKSAPWKKGEACEFWRGGTSKLQAHLRTCIEYKQWRRVIFSRDKFKCVKCGGKGGRSNPLNADHVKPFSVLIKENNIKTIEEAHECAALWDINNGRTLCLLCHQQTETWGRNLLKKKNQAS